MPANKAVALTIYGKLQLKSYRQNYLLSLCQAPLSSQSMKFLITKNGCTPIVKLEMSCQLPVMSTCFVFVSTQIYPNLLVFLKD